MYNEERKLAFIRGYTKSVNTSDSAVAVFNTIQPYEEALQKDMASFTTEELRPVTDTVLGVKSAGKRTRITLLREYVRWCQTNHLPDVLDSITHVDISGLDKMREQTVSGPLQLQNYFNQVFTPENEETVDNIYRCWLWMAFSGVREEDTVEILDTDVDFSEMLIRLREEEYPLYREALPAFKNAVGLTSFRYIHPNYSDSRTVLRDRVPGHLLLRGIKSTTKISTLRSSLSRHLSECQKNGRTDKGLSFSRLEMSGAFYRAYEQERAGIPPDFSDYIVRLMERQEYTRESQYIRWARNQREKDCLDDYQRWKLAYSI